MTRNIDGQLSAQGLRFVIVAGRFNSFMAENLISGAVDAIVRHGGNEDHITVARVPGSFEIPLICKKFAESGKADAVIALGVVIRGSTSHYDYVCNESAKGIASVSLETGVPVSFGIVTTENIEQAIERCGSKAGNKGVDAAIAAIEMVNLIKAIERKK